MFMLYIILCILTVCNFFIVSEYALSRFGYKRDLKNSKAKENLEFKRARSDVVASLSRFINEVNKSSVLSSVEES